MLTKILVSIVFYLFYWFCCCLGTGTDRKNLGGLRSYPDTVQQAVREHPVLGKSAPKEKSTLSILLGIPLSAVVAVISAGIIMVIK